MDQSEYKGISHSCLHFYSFLWILADLSYLIMQIIYLIVWGVKRGEWKVQPSLFSCLINQPDLNAEQL